MTEDKRFEAMSDKGRIMAMAKIMDNDYESISITLDTGETILGDISSRTYQEYYIYTEKQKHRFMNPVPILDYIVLLFPREDDEKLKVEIPVNRISSIEGIRSFYKPPEGYLRNLPSQFSKGIMEHNMEIINKNDFNITEYIEKELLQSQKIKRGVKFQGYEIIYADWDYFSTINGGINNIGSSVLGVGGSVGWKKSLQDVFLKKIRNDNINFGKLFSNRNPYQTEVNIKGYIKEDKEEQDTEMEGDTWNVYYIEIENEKTKYKCLPLLVKKSNWKYPPEFIPYIISILTFYGEIRQIPVSLTFDDFDFCLQARAIAHLP